MNCKNHPDRPATGRCSECEESFCEDCLSKFNQRDYCGACLKTEAAIATAKMAGSGEELARMKHTLVGCSMVLLALVVIPMLLLIYPMFRLGDIGRCRANLKKLYQEALLIYAEQNNEQFPPDNNDLKPLFDKGLVKTA
ncbi:MAG: B-box zinc finger protein, partial [bacterium]|nr:B-box zinc finger protein [bacterium]